MKVTGIDAERRWSESMPAAYEQYLVPVVFRPFAEDLAARAAALHPGVFSNSPPGQAC